MAEKIFQYINKILDKKPGSTIFHYSNQKGLLGIVKSKSLWAMSIHYLNDSTEFSHAIGIAKSELNRYRATINDENIRDLFIKLEERLTRIENVNIFVFSFSENGDLLSQWRGYCHGESGFSIGFEYSDLIKSIESQNFILAPCMYESEEQHRIIQELIAKVLILHLHEKKTQEIDGKFMKKLSSIFINDFVRYGPILKHPSFSEEKEWRLISPIVSMKHPQVNHREGNMLITPYFNFKLSENSEFSLSKIIVGPSPHMELSMNSVFGLLGRNNILKSTIERSHIPFRSI